MLTILWALAVLLFIFWLLGVVLHFAGGLIYILLVVAVLIVLYNLFIGRRAV